MVSMNPVFFEAFPRGNNLSARDPVMNQKPRFCIKQANVQATGRPGWPTAVRAFKGVPAARGAQGLSLNLSFEKLLHKLWQLFTIMLELERNMDASLKWQESLGSTLGAT
jgi:hypothetical protein